MVSLELLNEFIYDVLEYDRDIICNSFIVVSAYSLDYNYSAEFIDISAIRLSKLHTHNIIIELERYSNWLQSRREDKINRIFIDIR